jgi:hypothetical protein
MASNIGALQNLGPQYSYQTSAVTQNPVQSLSAAAASEASQPIEDFIQLSAAGLAALQEPEEIVTGDNAGDAQGTDNIKNDKRGAESRKDREAGSR